jgi:hypothetical protein
MQSDTVASTPAIYQRLIDARTVVDQMNAGGPPGTDIVPLPSAVLDRLVDALSGQSASRAPEDHRPTPMERMETARAASVTKASQDFRHQRAWPLAGLSALAAAIWGSRQAFGVNLSKVGAIGWGIGAGAVLIVAVVLLGLTQRGQMRDEQVLRRLYDPETQASALESIAEFPRWLIEKEDDYHANVTDALARLVVLAYFAGMAERTYAADETIRQILRHSRNYAIDDLARLVNMEIEERRKKGADRDDRYDSGSSNSWFSRTQFREMLSSAAGVVPHELTRSTDVLDRFATRLSTVDLAAAVDDASELALARFIDMKVIHSSVHLGRELFSFEDPSKRPRRGR